MKIRRGTDRAVHVMMIVIPLKKSNRWLFRGIMKGLLPEAPTSLILRCNLGLQHNSRQFISNHLTMVSEASLKKRLVSLNPHEFEKKIYSIDGQCYRYL